MRKAISMMLETDPGITVVDTARDGQEAITKVLDLRPDIVTLDVEMPRMDGLTALRHIMAETPVPVLMISSLTKEGATTTVEALHAGAVDFIPKADSTVSLAINQIRDDLITKVHAIINRRRGKPEKVVCTPDRSGRDIALDGCAAIVIGTSTGGPFALHQVIPRLPADFPLPILVVQHMPPHFTRSLAERIDGLSPLHVREAEDGDAVEAGTVLIAPGGHHMLFDQRGGQVVVRTSSRPDTLHKPSVDVMFSAAADAFERPLAAVVMTGMGRDGRDGCVRIKDEGGYVIAQDEASCVVYGMPRAVCEARLADQVVALDGIAPLLVRAVSPQRRTQPAY